jgi:energy-coupling factor transporter ATP-binding protein EcfA2
MIRFVDFGHTYPGTTVPSLADVSLTLPAGCLTLVAGPSGAGKSTLLRAINGLVPHFSGGTVRGAVRVGADDPIALGPGVMSARVGFVSGDPERACIMDTVADEVAFALENRGVDGATMRARVADALARVGLADAGERAIASLSGGERQRVVIAAALALTPAVLVLDEPTSQLDDASAALVLATVAELAARGDLTVVLSEHRLDRVLPLAGHMVHLPGPGQPPREGTPAAILPTLARPVAAPAPPAAPGPERFAFDDVWFGFGERSVLRGASLAAGAGEVVALTGPSGSGKTTLLRLAVGLLQPERGTVRVDGLTTAGRAVADICRQVAYLPQDPDALLFAATVRDELRVTLTNHNLAPTGPYDPDDRLAALGIADLAGRYPRDLSTGQRQRVALAAVTVTRPGVLVLDEPTRGLDDGAIAALATLLHAHAAAGAAVLVATHDRRLTRAAHRVVTLGEGRIESAGACDG